MKSRRQFIGGILAAAGAAATRGLAQDAPRWQIGCYTRPWDQDEYRVALDGIAAAGYKYAGLMTAKNAKSNLVVGVDTTPEEAAAIGGEVRQRGLQVASLYGGSFHAEKSIEAGIAGLRRLIENAAACRCANLLLGGTDEQHAAAYYKAVAECCDYAAAKGVGLSIKPHGGGNANGPQCRKLIEQVGHKSFRLWYDPGNIFYYSDGQLDPLDDAATVDGLVVGMSVKDFRPPKEVMLTPGTGRVEFAKVLARLRQGGFTGGPLVVECVARGDKARIMAEARAAREFVEQLTKSAS